MSKTDLVLDLAVEGLSLWRPVEGADWKLLGFSGFDDPELAARIAQMRATAKAVAGPKFSTMLLLPDDHVWVRRLDLGPAGTAGRDALARAELARASGVPLTLFSLAIGETGADGLTTVAATTTDVLGEARDFAATHGFNPKVIAARSFFDGFATRPVFEDRGPPLAFLPRGLPAALPRRLPALPQRLLGGVAAASVATLAFAFWYTDPWEVFLRPPRADDSAAAMAEPAPVAGLPVFAGLAPPGRAGLPALEPQPLAPLPVLSGTVAAGASGVQLSVAFEGNGVVFALPSALPQPPAGLGERLAWTAPAAMFLETPEAEPVIGVAAWQRTPELAPQEVPGAAGPISNVTLASVSSRSAEALALAEDVTRLLPDTEFAALADRTLLPLGTSPEGSLADPGITTGGAPGIMAVPDLDDSFSAPVELAALGTLGAVAALADDPLTEPTAPLAMPGSPPRPRPDSVVRPSEAAAALTPANEPGPVFGPDWPGRAAIAPETVAPEATEFVAGSPGHIRPKPRPALTEGPEVPAEGGTGLLAGLTSGIIEFDAGNPAHLRPKPRSAVVTARASAEAAEASLLALNLSPEALIDRGLGWEEYNSENPAHVRPKARPASLQDLAAAGDLAPTALAVAQSSRPRSRPEGLEALMFARREVIAAAEKAAAEAEARAQSVAEAAALALAEAQGEAAPDNPPSELAELDDAEPEASFDVASLPTSASVAEAATIENGLDRADVSLIGIYGTESRRRALIRLASGRYERVTVGDTFSGYKVAAIGNDAIRLVKGGRELVLRMPN